MASPESDAPPKRSSSTLLMIAAFVFVILIMFDNNLRLATGDMVGRAFNPVASFWGFDILWTLVFASFVMIIATTIIRHFLVDWVRMARVQEVMRTFQREFSSARKANNTYQIKRLTDMQPEIMQMQAEMSTGQLKPMAFTMVIVIPIFAWLSTFTAAPVAFDAELEGGAEGALVFAVNGDLRAAGLVGVGDGDAVGLLNAVDVYAVPLPGASASGTVRLQHPVTEDVTALGLGGLSLDWSQYAVGDLPPGDYRVQPIGDERVRFTLEEQHNTLNHLVVAVPQGGSVASANVTVVTGNGGTLHLEEASTVYVLVPMAAETNATGAIRDEVRRVDTQEVVATWNVTLPQHLVPVTLAGAGASGEKIVPHSLRLPWNPTSDLTGTWWVLPHWILLYSLFSIPIGQLTQKLLKLIEYSKVDLDADGKAPGLTPE